MSTHMFFFFNDTATTEIYSLSLHDALPISRPSVWGRLRESLSMLLEASPAAAVFKLSVLPAQHAAQFENGERSEEHTSELQSRLHLVCRLLLEKKKYVRSDDIARIHDLQYS